MMEGVPIWRRWHEPAIQAALVNAALVAFAPTAFLAYRDYMSEVVRPSPPTLVASVIRALPLFLMLVPIATLAAFRTYMWTVAYQARRITWWRGPVESGAIAGAFALLMMLLVTIQAWFHRPPYLVAAYIAFYVVGTALIGLALGLVLAGSALLVLAMHPRSVSAS
jgi:hypothetical protein